MSSLPAWVQPTPESTILVSGGSINVTGNLLDCIWGATSGIQVAAWDFAAVKSKVLVVCPQLGAGKTQAIPGVFCQNAALSGTEMDNGYVSLMSSTGLHLYKESTGFTELDPEDEIAPSGVAGTAHNPFFGMALYYSDADDLLVGFVQNGFGWAEVLRKTAETTFTTMLCAGIRFSSSITATKNFCVGPTLIFTEA